MCVCVWSLRKKPQGLTLPVLARRYYAEIRDRCIKVRILQEIARGDEASLASRLKVLAERSRHFARECGEVAGLIAGAQAELEQTVAEVQMPRTVRLRSHRCRCCRPLVGLVGRWCVGVDVEVGAKQIAGTDCCVRAMAGFGWLVGECCQELEAEREAAQQQLHRLHAHIEEQEKVGGRLRM